MTDSPRWDWRSPLLNAAGGCLLGIAVGWAGRPTVEGAQSAATAAGQQASTTAQITSLAAQVTALAVKIDALTERSFSAYTRADASADRADVARHFDALDGRVGQLEQELSGIQHQATGGTHR